MNDPLRDEIRSLKAYSVTPAEGLIKLDAMENPYPLPADAQRALGTHLGTALLNRYPSPVAKSLKHRLSRMTGLDECQPMVLGNGSDELIQMLILAVARPGAVILGVQPAFVMFHLLSVVAGTRFVGVDLCPDFSLDLTAMLEAIRIHRPALIFLAYPNNPTGNHFDKVAMGEIIRAAAPGWVVVDEAYYPFTDRHFVAELSRFPNLLLMRTLSKLGLAGIRLGWLTGPKALIHEIDKLRLPYNISVLDQMAAEWVLDQESLLSSQIQSIVEQRGWLLSRLADFSALTVFPSAANFVLFRAPEAGRLFDGLLHRGILIKKLDGAHRLLGGCLRVTVGTPEENRQFIVALSGLLSPASITTHTLGNPCAVPTSRERL